MSKVLVSEKNLTNIANAIKEKKMEKLFRIRKEENNYGVFSKTRR